MRHRLLTACVLMGIAMPATATDNSLQCGKLFDSRSGKMLGAHTIVVRDGRIAEVLQGRAEAAAGTQAVDLSDRTCMAGWTDLHVHLGGESSPQSYSEGFRLDDIDFAFRSIGYAEKTLMAGFTSVRDLGGGISPHLRDAINKGLCQGPADMGRRQVDRHHRRPCRPDQWLQLRAVASAGPARPHRRRDQLDR